MKINSLRYIDQVCGLCRLRRAYGLKNKKKSRAEILISEGWKKIKSRWVCPACAGEE